MAAIIANNPATNYIKHWESLKAAKSNFDNHCEEVRQLVRPNAGEFSGKLAVGSKRTIGIFDDTAVLANVTLASALSAFLTPANMRFFNYIVRDQNLMKRDDVLLYLEELADATYFHMALQECGFYTQGDEAMGDITAFGTSVELPEWNPASGVCVFETFPLASISMAENDFNKIDTVYRELTFTTKKVIQRFGDSAPSKIREQLEKDPFREWRFLHVVEPREMYDSTKWDNKNMPFKSCWICLDTKNDGIVSESGYRYMRYIISRWSTSPGEVNGRGPAMNCLHVVKVLNETAKLLLQKTQLQAGPPMVYDRDGFNGPLQAFPWAVNERNDPNSKAEQLFQLADSRDPDQRMTEMRQTILQAFFVDKLMLSKNNVEMRHVEVLQRIDEGLKMMGPQINRLQSECLGKKIKILFNMLMANGKFDHIEKPSVLNGYNLGFEIEYVSPAAKAQLSGKAIALERFMEALGKIGQVDPNAFDIVKLENVGSELALHLDVSRKVLRTKDELASLRQQREQKEAVMLAANAGQQIAKTSKDFASARKDMAEAGVAL